MKPTIFFYLHGFNARFDTTAQKVVAFQNVLPVVGFTINYLNDDEVIKLEESIIKLLKTNELIFVGSSLGGYMAMYFANKYKMPCILLNPSMHPTKTLLNDVGTIQIDFLTKKTQLVTIEKINNLKKYNVTNKKDLNCLLLLAKDDEILDYNIALNELNGSSIIKEFGGHRLTNIEDYMSDVSIFINKLQSK